MKKPVDSNNSQPQAVRPSAAPTEGCWRSEASSNGHHRYMGKWETPFFGCFKDVVPNCLMAFFCPCVSLAQISARLGVYSYKFILITSCYVVAAMFVLSGIIAHEIYMNESSWEGYWTALNSVKHYSTAYTVYNVLMILPMSLWVWLLTRLREETRLRFKASGGFLDVLYLVVVLVLSLAQMLCLVFWCSGCITAQMATRVKSYKPGQWSFGPPDTLPPYPYPLDDEHDRSQE